MIDPTRTISSRCNLICAMLGVVQNIFSPVHICRQFVDAEIDKVGASRCNHLGNTRLTGRLQPVAGACGKAAANISATIS